MADKLGLAKSVLARRLNACVSIGLLERVEPKIKTATTTIKVGSDAASILASGSQIISPEALEKDLGAPE
jgi:hypothetical protein